MLQLATPPGPPRSPFFASAGLHVFGACALLAGPLLVLPDTPGWTGEVVIRQQPDLSRLFSRPIDLGQAAPASAGRPAGGVPSAPSAGPVRAPQAPAVQPSSIPGEIPPTPDTPPAETSGVVGGLEGGGGGSGGTGEGTGIGGETDGPVDVRGALPPDLDLPVPLATPAPRYPDAARLARISGAVILAATIGADGRISDVAVERGINPLLDRAAAEAVSTWRYRPARLAGREVAVILRVTITFSLR